MQNDQNLINLEFSIIGFGRVGAGLARSLTRKGGICTGILTSDRSKLDDKVSGLHFPALVEYSNLGRFCFICVPDDQISVVADQLSKYPDIPSNTNFIHVSGTRSSHDLTVLSKKGHLVASFHPLQTFNPQADIEIFRDILISIEGDEELKVDLYKIAALLSARPLSVSPEQKKTIHIAAVFVSNFQSALVLEAGKVIGTQFENAEHFVRQNYSSLMQQTVLNIIEKGFPDALTGPAARNDQNTIQQHINYLNDNGLNSSLYSELSDVIRRYLKSE
ncbi:MAG TPA: hypothetical protein DCE78_00125 [Bacteroidetes bacterium]|nr:hypothetical protein [Bacteroidota bacterium]